MGRESQAGVIPTFPWQMFLVLQNFGRLHSAQFVGYDEAVDAPYWVEVKHFSVFLADILARCSQFG